MGCVSNRSTQCIMQTSTQVPATPPTQRPAASRPIGLLVRNNGCACRRTVTKEPGMSPAHTCAAFSSTQRPHHTMLMHTRRPANKTAVCCGQVQSLQSSSWLACQHTWGMCAALKKAPAWAPSPAGSQCSPPSQKKPVSMPIVAALGAAGTRRTLLSSTQLRATTFQPLVLAAYLYPGFWHCTIQAK